MVSHQVFVIHSAYPDGSWRGLEKCVSAVDNDGTLVFQTREEAEAHLAAEQEDVQCYLRVVEVTLFTPRIRGALDSATMEKVDPLMAAVRAAVAGLTTEKAEEET